MSVICIRKCIYAQLLYIQPTAVHPSRDRLYYYVITSYSQPSAHLIQTPHVYQLSTQTLHHLYTHNRVYYKHMDGVDSMHLS